MMEQSSHAEEKSPLMEYRWSIKNFSMLSPQLILRSTEFGASPYKFHLDLYPYGIDFTPGTNSVYVTVKMSRLDDFGGDDVSFVCRMRVQPTNIKLGSAGTSTESFVGPQDILPKTELMKINKDYKTSMFKLISRTELYSSVSNFLFDDTLTICCLFSRILNDDNIPTDDNISPRESPFCDVLTNIFLSGEYSDVVLKIDSKRYNAHKIILESRCPGFLGFFRKVKHPNVFSAENIEASDLESLLKYFYTGFVDLTKTRKQFPSLFGEYGLHYLIYALEHAQKQTMHVTSEVPISSIKFPWVITEFYAKLQTGDMIMCPSFFIPESDWNEIKITLTLEVSDNADATDFRNVLIKFKKLPISHSIFMKGTIFFGNDPNKNSKLCEIENFFQSSQIVKKVSLREIHKKLTGNCLHLFFHLQLSKSPVYVKKDATFQNVDTLKLWQRLKQDFENILSKNDPYNFSDVHLIVGETTFNVHRVFLCAQSPVFQIMFQDGLRDFCEITDISPSTMSLLLQYLYGRNFKELAIESAIKLYEAAYKYEVLPLAKKCANFIKEGFSGEHIGEALMLSFTHYDKELQSFILDFIFTNPGEVLHNPNRLDALTKKPGLLPDIFMEILKRHRKLLPICSPASITETPAVRSFKEVDIKSAIKLYETAAEYKVLPLVEKYRKIIKEGFCSSLCGEQFGEALMLSYSHNDKELQSFLLDFILKNPGENLVYPNRLDALTKKPSVFPNIFMAILRRYRRPLAIYSPISSIGTPTPLATNSPASSIGTPAEHATNSPSSSTGTATVKWSNS